VPNMMKPICGGALRPWEPFYQSASRSVARRELRSVRARPGGEAALSVANASARHPRSLLMDVRADLQEKETPLRAAYCKGKHMDPAPALQELSVGQQALARCLRAGHRGCPAWMRESALGAANALPSMRLLASPPKCFTVLEGGPCSSLVGNPETLVRGRYLSAIRPSTDWKWRQWGSCALVGRSPVIKIEENGPAIDNHDAVWRFNLQSTKGFSNFVGKKTSVRVVNNGDSARAALGLRGKSEQSMFQVADETWAFWQYNSIINIPQIHLKLKAKTRLLAPAFLKWQMDVYFALKRDLEGLGFGPFHCPTSVSSGIHAVYMAIALCNKVSVFGYSYYDQMLTTRAGHNNGPQPFFTGHSWKLDLTMVRILALAGHLDVCTGDDPSIALEKLVSRVGKDY